LFLVGSLFSVQQVSKSKDAKRVIDRKCDFIP
jgi:hypothetical protein